MQSNEYGDTITLAQVIGFLKRNLFFLVLSALLAGAIAYLVSDYIPRKYKSKAVLSIQSSYFRHPLVNDFISEVQESSEMSSQRLSLLRLALNDQFLDTIGEKYGFYKEPADSPLRQLDREMLLKRIEYFSVTPTSFQISVGTGTPYTSYAVTKDVLKQMTYTLTEQRYSILETARDSILKQAKLFKSTLSDAPTPQQQELENQLAKMEANLAALRSKFTESHPDVAAARAQANALQSKVKRKPEKPAQTATSDDYTTVFLSPASRSSTQEIFNDLLKKLSHLNIVLEMERDRDNVSYLSVIEQPAIPTKPYFPNKLYVTLGGCFAGLALGLVRVVFLELKRAQYRSPEQTIAAYGFELIGELPHYIAPKELPLLGAGPRPVAALPRPAEGR